MRNPKSGFTIVELLIVIVVIGILAAITIVAFNGIQNRGYDTTIKNDLKSFKTKMELSKVDGGELYPTSTDLPALKFKASQSAYSILPTDGSNLFFCYSNDDRTIYALVAKSKSGNMFSVTNTTGVESYTGSFGNPCTVISANLPLNWRGYASEDTTSGPWRPWVR